MGMQHPDLENVRFSVEDLKEIRLKSKVFRLEEQSTALSRNSLSMHVSFGPNILGRPRGFTVLRFEIYVVGRQTESGNDPSGIYVRCTDKHGQARRIDVDEYKTPNVDGWNRLTASRGGMFMSACAPLPCPVGSVKPFIITAEQFREKDRQQKAQKIKVQYNYEPIANRFKLRNAGKGVVAGLVEVNGGSSSSNGNPILDSKAEAEINSIDEKKEKCRKALEGFRIKNGGGKLPESTVSAFVGRFDVRGMGIEQEFGAKTSCLLPK